MAAQPAGVSTTPPSLVSSDVNICRSVGCRCCSRGSASLALTRVCHCLLSAVNLHSHVGLADIMRLFDEPKHFFHSHFKRKNTLGERRWKIGRNFPPAYPARRHVALGSRGASQASRLYAHRGTSCLCTQSQLSPFHPSQQTALMANSLWEGCQQGYDNERYLR